MIADSFCSLSLPCPSLSVREFEAVHGSPDRTEDIYIVAARAPAWNCIYLFILFMSIWIYCGQELLYNWLWNRLQVGYIFLP